MHIEHFREYCLSKTGVTEELPFGPDTLVFKVMGKIFAITPLDTESFSISLKCRPELAERLREIYDFVTPGYHLNKKHWNTIAVGTNVSNDFIKKWTDHSYDLVVLSLPKNIQATLKNET
jgi:predicted DNA-binding protein (MmcQ/YjbR family)